MSNLEPLRLLESDPLVEADTQIPCCGQVMEVTRTQTRRTHHCRICKSRWFIDVKARTMFGISFHVSDQVPSTKVIDV